MPGTGRHGPCRIEPRVAACTPRRTQSGSDRPRGTTYAAAARLRRAWTSMRSGDETRRVRAGIQSGLDASIASCRLPAWRPIALPAHDHQRSQSHATRPLPNIADTGSTSKATFAAISAASGATPDMGCTERGGSACFATRADPGARHRADDAPGDDLLVCRLRVHEEHAWMLQALLRWRRSTGRERGRTAARSLLWRRSPRSAAAAAAAGGGLAFDRPLRHGDAGACQAGGNVAFGQRGRDAQGAGERIEVGQRRRILRLQLLLQRGQVDAAGVELYVELHGLPR